MLYWLMEASSLNTERRMFTNELAACSEVNASPVMVAVLNVRLTLPVVLVYTAVLAAPAPGRPGTVGMGAAVMMLEPEALRADRASPEKVSPPDPETSCHA